MKNIRYTVPVNGRIIYVCDDFIGDVVVSLFGGSVSSMWFPYDRTRHPVIENNCAVNLACHTCVRRNLCVQDISVDDVYNAAKNLLGI